MFYFFKELFLFLLIPFLYFVSIFIKDWIQWPALFQEEHVLHERRTSFWCKHVCLEAVVCICSSKQVFSKFCKFHRKTPVLESLFNKVATLAEETLTQVHSISLPPSFYWGTTFSPKSWKVVDQKKMSVWGDLNSSYHIYLPGEEGGGVGGGLTMFLVKKIK